MKELYLIRHAKSSWDRSGLDDHDRPLNERGLEAAPLVGEALAARGVNPDLILSSTAVRALTTARIVAGKLGYPESDIVEEEGIYLAGTSRLLEIVRGIDEAHGCALLFGHNPGFHDLAEVLTGARIDRFVTAAVARIRFDTAFWGSIEPGEGELVEHLWPAMLAREGAGGGQPG